MASLHTRWTPPRPSPNIPALIILPFLAAVTEYSPASAFDSWLTIGTDAGDPLKQLSTTGIPKFSNSSFFYTRNGAVSP